MKNKSIIKSKRVLYSNGNEHHYHYDEHGNVTYEKTNEENENRIFKRFFIKGHYGVKCQDKQFYGGEQV